MSQPQEEAAGAVRPGPAQLQLLRLCQQARSHGQTERPEDHGALPAGPGKGSRSGTPRRVNPLTPADDAESLVALVSDPEGEVRDGRSRRSDRGRQRNHPHLVRRRRDGG